MFASLPNNPHQKKIQLFGVNHRSIGTRCRHASLSQWPAGSLVSDYMEASHVQTIASRVLQLPARQVKQKCQNNDREMVMVYCFIWLSQ